MCWKISSGAVPGIKGFALPCLGGKYGTVHLKRSKSQISILRKFYLSRVSKTKNIISPIEFVLLSKKVSSVSTDTAFCFEYFFLTTRVISAPGPRRFLLLVKVCQVGNPQSRSTKGSRSRLLMPRRL